jgi:hypothetical protein
MKCATCINRVMKSCLEPIDKVLVNNCKGVMYSPDYSTYVVYFSVGCMIGNAILWTSN